MQSRIALIAVVIALALLGPPGARGQSQPGKVFILPEHAQIIAGEFAATGRAEVRVGLIPTNADEASDPSHWFSAAVSAYHECLQGIPETSVRVIVAPDTMLVFIASVTPAGLELLQKCAATSAILSESRLR